MDTPHARSMTDGVTVIPRIFLQENSRGIQKGRMCLDFWIALESFHDSGNDGF